VPAVLPWDDVQHLPKAAEPGNLQLTVDLVQHGVVQPDGSLLHFSIPASERSMLLEGLDAIGLTLKRRSDIEAFQEVDRRATMDLDIAASTVVA